MHALVLGVLVCVAGELRTDRPRVDGAQAERPAERPAICELGDPSCRFEQPFDAPARATLALIHGDPILLAIFPRLSAPNWGALRYLTADTASARPGFARRVERPPRR